MVQFSCRGFFVVTDREKLEALSAVSPYAGTTKQALAAVISACRMACWISDYAQVDLSIAMENLWLVTDDQGLGGVWPGTAPLEDRMKTAEEIIGMRDTFRASAGTDFQLYNVFDY